MTDDLVKMLRSNMTRDKFYISADMMCHEAANCIEALEADNARLRHAALVREERIAELERQLHAAVAEVSEAGRRQGDAEAKLDKAARFVAYIAGENTDHVRVALAGNPTVCAEICSEASATLAEITGGEG